MNFYLYNPFRCQETAKGCLNSMFGTEDNIPCCLPLFCLGICTSTFYVLLQLVVQEYFDLFVVST